MSTPPTSTPPTSSPPPQDLNAALTAIGNDSDARARLVRCLREIEAGLDRPGEAVRETVTGPVLDAACGDAPLLTKTLSDGTRFEYLYRSKISRDITLSDVDEPDHLWEPQTTRLLCHLARGAEHVVVGGAYLGDHAVLIARTIEGSGGAVHAFEPNPEQFASLQRNAELNGLSNLHMHRQGLWDEAGVSLSLIGDDAYAASEAVAGDTAPDVGFSTNSITAYAEGLGIDRIGLIMLDVEGAEFRALKGAARFLEAPASEAPQVVFEIHRHYVDWSDGLDRTDVGAYMVERGYSLFAVRDFHSNVSMAGRPIELIPAAEVYLEGPPHGFNLLATKTPERFDGEPFKLVKGVSPKLLWHKDPALHHPTE